MKRFCNLLINILGACVLVAIVVGNIVNYGNGPGDAVLVPIALTLLLGVLVYGWLQDRRHAKRMKEREDLRQQ
jgi:hypothetical protein